MNGKGGPRDPDLAVRLFKYAAARKHSGAMFALGVVHSGGYGVPADLEVARGWLLEAARLNHGQARLALDQLPSAGTGEEREAAIVAPEVAAAP